MVGERLVEPVAEEVEGDGRDHDEQRGCEGGGGVVVEEGAVVGEERPQSGAPGGTPRPRKERALRETTAPAKLSRVLATTTGRTLGQMCRTATVARESPSVSAAST